LHLLYKKWLRFYLDFCRKYRFSENERKSLDHFLQKLHEKEQTEAQRQQASHAIILYYDLDKNRAESSDKPPLSQKVMISRENAEKYIQTITPQNNTSKDSSDAVPMLQAPEKRSNAADQLLAQRIRERPAHVSPFLIITAG
jgi:hypothetical protein